MKVSCPQCGGSNEVTTAVTFIKCEFCKSSLLIDWDGIAAVFSFAPAVETNKLESLLEYNLKKSGITEKIEIFDAIPVYLPFFLPGGDRKESRLLNASSRFKGKEIPMPGGEKINFNTASIIEKNIEIVPICSLPENSNKQALYYIPFFQAKVRLKELEYTFFINAVNGDIHGDPIPYISLDTASTLFPYFIGVFIILLLINSIFNYMPLVMLLCLTAMFIVHRYVNHFWEKGVPKP
jgi:hypothetical protein